MKHFLHLKIILPLTFLYKNDDNLDFFINTLNELLDLNKKIKVDIQELGEYPVSISILKKYRPLYNEIGLPIPLYSAIVFKISVPNFHIQRAMVAIESNPEITDSHNESFMDFMWAMDFKDKVYYFLILCQIAKPGSLQTRRGEVYVNGTFVSPFPGLMSLHRDVLYEIKKIQWPKYKSIPLKDAWSYCKKNFFSLQRCSTTRVERALNAFTYLFNNDLNTTVISLFWALIGIEALYCSEKEGKSSQIFLKTQAFLGPITDYKTRIKNMYSFRSNLIHGEADFLSKGSNLHSTEGLKFDLKLYESTLMAISILTATLQSMIFENKEELKFKYILD